MNFSDIKLILLDRDGVINIKKSLGYVNTLSEFELMEGVLDFLDFLDNSEKRTAIVTNQQGLSTGATTFQNFFEIQGTFFDMCVRRGITPPHLFYCPHLKDKCECRKPKSGMLAAALSTYNLCPREVLVIGDSLTDVLAASILDISCIHLTEKVETECGCAAVFHARDFNQIIDFLE